MPIVSNTIWRMQSRAKVRLITLLLLVCFFGCRNISSKEGEIMLENKTVNLSQIEVKLDISIAEKDVKAVLIFTNTSSTDAYVERINGCLDGNIKNNVFKITADNQKIDYIGILAKRRPPEPNDFVKLQPNEQINTQVKLNEAYEFLPGTHKYQVFYTAYHSFPDRDDIVKLESNKVDFTYNK